MLPLSQKPESVGASQRTKNQMKLNRALMPGSRTSDRRHRKKEASASSSLRRTLMKTVASLDYRPMNKADTATEYICQALP